MNFVQNILWNSVEGFVEAGTRTAGGYAGDALIKAGDLVENSGRSFGNRIEHSASGYGTKVLGQAYQPGGKALPSTARKPALTRSKSSPVDSTTRKNGTKAIGPTSKTSIGGKKHPGGPGTASEKTAGEVSGVQKGVDGTQQSVGGGPQKAITGRAVNRRYKSLPKPFPNNQPYGTTAKPSTKTGVMATKSAIGVKQNPAALPKPNNTPSYSAEKKIAVKPGQAKPLNLLDEEQKNAGSGAIGKNKAPYPGTNTLPGQGSRTPVRPQKYKPLERMKAPAEKGKVQHIAVG